MQIKHIIQNNNKIIPKNFTEKNNFVVIDIKFYRIL